MAAETKNREYGNPVARSTSIINLIAASALTPDPELPTEFNMITGIIFLCNNDDAINKLYDVPTLQARADVVEALIVP